MPKPKRDWNAAIDKRDEEGRCRVCEAERDIQAAHTIGRKAQDEKRWYPGDSASSPSVLYVNPDSIVPLCQSCHYKYDDRKLDLLPHMTREEEANAALAVGLIAATRRVTSGGYE